MFWKLLCLVFGAAGILSAILCRRKLCHQEHRMEELTNQRNPTFSQLPIKSYAGESA